MLHVTYYLEVTSSWCHWAEPAWAELKERYPDRDRVAFDWQIALMPPEAYPVSRSQCEWFYRRSGSIMRSPYMLNPGWFEPELRQYLAPNCAAEAARDLGVGDDRVRLALATAGLREGRKIGRWEVAISIAAEAGNLEPGRLGSRAESPEVAARLHETTESFHRLQVSQRPTFVLRNDIGDRAVFSGLARSRAIMVAMDEMLADEAAYASWAAHFGEPPPG